MKKFVLVLLPIVVFLLPLYLRALSESRRHLELAYQHLEQKRDDLVLQDLRRSVSWAPPVDLAPQLAGDLFMSLASESGREVQFRIKALREYRRGLMSSRNFWNWPLLVWSKGPLKKIDEKLAELAPRSSGKARVHEITPPRVHFAYQILGQFMFFGWVVAVLNLILHGFTQQGQVVGRNFLRGSLAAGIFYTLWLMSLSLA